MGAAELVEDLRRLGFEAAQVGDFAVFEWTVECGPLSGEAIELALNGQSWPTAPPGGPLVSPKLLTEGQPGEHPLGGVHPAPSAGFPDPDGRWQYWSRPCSGWREGLGANDYMCHIRRLFDTLPDDLQRGTDN